jgi:hypothetical protein
MSWSHDEFRQPRSIQSSPPRKGGRSKWQDSDLGSSRDWPTPDSLWKYDTWWGRPRWRAYWYHSDQTPPWEDMSNSGFKDCSSWRLSYTKLDPSTSQGWTPLAKWGWPPSDDAQWRWHDPRHGRFEVPTPDTPCLKKPHQRPSATASSQFQQLEDEFACEDADYDENSYLSMSARPSWARSLFTEQPHLDKGTPGTRPPACKNGTPLSPRSDRYVCCQPLCPGTQFLTACSGCGHPVCRWHRKVGRSLNLRWWVCPHCLHRQ